MLTKTDRAPKRILVVRPDRVGDVVLSTPVFHTLKVSFPGCYVGALVSPYTSPLLAGNPNIDLVITDDPGKEARRGDPFLKKVMEIRKHKFDTALLLMPTERLAYMLFLAGIRRRFGVGHILYEVITMTRGVSRRKYNPLRHESDYMLDLARKFGAREIWTKPEIFLRDDERTNARLSLRNYGFDLSRSIVCIHPGSGHSSPNWTIDRYAGLAGRLAKAGLQVLVTGSSHEKSLEDSFQGLRADGVKTIFGELSLRELAAVISEVTVFVSSSTGPMHIAAAVGTPTVSMFCPLTACSPKLWGPVGSSSRVILPPDDFCGTKCPGDPHVCTFGVGDEGIGEESVFEAVTAFASETEAQPSKGISDDYSSSHIG